MPWAFDLGNLKRNFILWLQARTEQRLERLRALRKRDMAELERSGEDPKTMAKSRRKMEAYFDHHEDGAQDFLIFLDRCLANNAASRMQRMRR